MAQLVVIHENCAKRKVAKGRRKTEAADHAIQPVGDVIGVFEDNHQFSPTERHIFEIKRVKGLTKKQVDSLMIPVEVSPHKFQFTVQNLVQKDFDNLDSPLVSNTAKEVILGTLRK